ncbi:MAG: flavodoxin [Eubacteriales bacterium]|nr:flavodoxin [Eubacteriales bacterium]
MSKVYIVYWTGTGNTAMMAGHIAEGVAEAGAEAVCLSVAEANVADLEEAKAIALGCPSMGAEQLEEMEMEPFMEMMDTEISGKNIGLFGSYGWGNGEWMDDWVTRVGNDGAQVVGGEGVICNGAPSEDAIEALKDLGRQLASLS